MMIKLWPDGATVGEESKAHIPPETGFALATKRKGNQHKNMKCTCPTPAPTPEAQRHLYSTDWHRGLLSGVTQITPDARVFTPDARVFTPDARVCFGCKIPTCWYPQRQILALGHCPTPTPDARYFASQWNIGLRYREAHYAFCCLFLRNLKALNDYKV